MKAKILEIFRSVQGEGKYVGVGQVFVRFFECNMNCTWCDTPHSIGDTTRKFDEYSVNDLWGMISELWDDCHSVSLTGGEPLMQTDVIRGLLEKFKKANFRSYLETNGIFHNELEQIIDDIDIIAMDIKLPSSTKCRPYWDEHEEFLKVARGKEVFVKTVISSETLRDDVMRSIELVAGIDPEILYILQPNYFDRHNGVLDKCLNFQKDCARHLSNVRILPQVHKIMKVR